MGYPADSENLHVRERWHGISADLLQADITVDRAEGLQIPYVRTPRYRQCASGLMKGQPCVARQHRDTGNGLNLTPLRMQQRGQ